MFEPIAIIGRGCALPGALTVAALDKLFWEGGVALAPPSPGAWRIEMAKALSLAGSDYPPDRSRLDIGGYVQGFEEEFRPEDYKLDQVLLARLDPLFQWTLHAARQALQEASLLDPPPHSRIGLIIGNLGYPTDSLNQLMECSVLRQLGREIPLPPVDPLNRFMSGLPAMLAAKGLGLKGPAFAIEAACASSLYAIKFACDLLHNHQADAMVAGGVNASDSLLLHTGFAALHALSPTGQSRPFHRDADGLVPSHGAACVVLKRLGDALRDGDAILALIRGVGLGNDGKSRGLLVPSSTGQVRCLRKTFAASGMDPSEISLIECHATGVALGDATEIESFSQIFPPGRSKIPIGSLKANLGHLITASGAAGVLKLVGALQNNFLPATPNATPSLPIIESSPFRVLSRSEPWMASDVPRRACIANFGFGGNNALLILEEWKGHKPSGRHPNPEPAQPIAIVGIKVKTHLTNDLRDFLNLALLATSPPSPHAPWEEKVAFSIRELPAPPADLEHTAGQQLLILKAALELLKELPSIDPEHTGVYIGAGSDPDACRSMLRWRFAELIKELHPQPDSRWVAAQEEAISPPLTAADVLGWMVNLIANRINKMGGLAGPGVTVMAEELSGDIAFQCACDALQRKEITTALVGAVDLSRERMHTEISKQLLEASWHQPADAAVLLVLKRLEDALAEGHTILAQVAPPAALSPLTIGNREPFGNLSRVVGHAHAASGLLHLAAAALMLHFRCVSGGAAQKPRPLFPQATAAYLAVHNYSFSGASSRVILKSHPKTSEGDEGLLPRPHIWSFDAPTYSLLRQAVQQKAVSTGKGPYRLAVIAPEGEGEAALQKALHLLKDEEPHSGWLDTQVYFRSEPLEGKLAFVYPSAISAYPAAGHDLFLGFPGLYESLKRHMSTLEVRGTDWFFDQHHPYWKSEHYLWQASLFLSLLHTRLSSEWMGLHPQIAVSMSAGEVSALLALGVWNDPEILLHRINQTAISNWVAGEHLAIQQAWRQSRVDWANWVVNAPLDDVKQIIAAWDKVYLTLIYSPVRSILSGDAGQCLQAVNEIGQKRAVRLENVLAAHCSALEPIKEVWREIHLLPTTPRNDIDFYSSYFNGPYPITPQNCADAATGHLLGTYDFPKMVRLAWDNGARIFVEHGARNQLSLAIGEILQGKPHLAVAMDSSLSTPFQSYFTGQSRYSALWQPYRVAAVLWCAGVAVRLDSINRIGSPQLLSPLSHTPEQEMEFSLRLQPIQLQPLPSSPPPSPSLIPEPLWNKEQLEVLASGKISSILGPLFAQQDGYAIQVRLPEPPLLLCDRVMAISGEPGSLGLGTIWTETDVREGSWYLHHHHMPMGILIESGQADLLLISYLGIDSINRGQRAYRLLGCVATLHGPLPEPGDTLRYEIHVDGHANIGELRLFFFHYDCYVKDQLLLTVRQGQAGFFTKEELAHAEGVLWDPATAHYTDNPCLDPPAVTGKKSCFSLEEVESFVRGDLVACFGPEYSLSQTHTRTPTTPPGRLMLLGAITDFDLKGGPKQRGYMRARLPVDPQCWFFQGHFKNDPCMPGTLMVDACGQLISFYLTALGYTLDKDGWRFDPVPEQPYQFICRGQCIPSSKELVYELFIDQILSSPTPTLYAHVLVTLDGLKSFVCEKYGMRLLPSWPIETMPELLSTRADLRPVAKIGDLKLDYNSLIHSALGKPTLAMGPLLAPYEQAIDIQRLPAPPYHFMTRIVHLEAVPQGEKVGSCLELLYDIPEQAWYFQDNAHPTLPNCVMMEVALQPCGWLSLFTLDRPRVQKLHYRNLDGKGTQWREIFPGEGSILTRTTLTNSAQFGDTVIHRFEVSCSIGGEEVYTLQTAFGFFTPEAMQNQIGLPPTAEQRAQLQMPSNYSCQVREAFPIKGKLLMLDRITGFWPEGGRAHKGYLRAEKQVHPSDWYFKAHFFHDPVQPGSLGIEAILQLLQWYLWSQRQSPSAVHFEPNRIAAPTEWHYRGQVIPTDSLIIVDADILEEGEEEGCCFVRADGRLWVRGLKIYEAPNVGVRLKA